VLGCHSQLLQIAFKRFLNDSLPPDHHVTEALHSIAIVTDIPQTQAMPFHSQSAGAGRSGLVIGAHDTGELLVDHQKLSVAIVVQLNSATDQLIAL
jgi:hypothetical protein